MTALPIRRPVLLGSGLLAILLGLFAVATPALARGGDMEFGPPPGPRAPAPTGEGTTAEAPRPTADDPIQADLADLERWPDRAGVRAAESLLLQGPEVVPYLVVILSDDESAAQPGAAWVLGHLGEPAHIQVLLRAAAKRRTGSRDEVFFQAAYDLDPAKTKHWLFSFLTLNRPVFRQKATDFLAQHVGEEDRPRVVNLLDADKPGVRIAGLRLLEPAKVPDAVARLMQALSDLDPDVGEQAAILLALRADDEVIQRLNALAVDGMPRERAYATLALVEVARTRPEINPFAPETLTELAGRRGLLHPEKLCRGSAAVGLAYGALDAPDPGLQALLDRTVVDVLLDTISGDHFRDFSSLVDPVFGALRRLSGQDLPSTAIAWAEWWRRERDTFQARRPLAGFQVSDLPVAYIHVDLVAADGGRRNATFRSEEATVADGDILLENDVMMALVGALEGAGIFEAGAVTPARADEHLQVTLGVLNQTRRLTVPADDARYPLLRMRFESLLDANRWQRYRDEDRWPDAKAWWRANVKALAQADPETRRALLKAAIVSSYDDLPGDALRGDALDLLDDLGREDAQTGSLTSSEVTNLVQAATAAVAFGDLEERAVRLAMSQPSARQVRAEIVEALAGRTEPVAAALLSDLIAAGGAEAVRDAFADPRAGMRAAGARAAQDLIADAKRTEPSAVPGLDRALRPGLEVLMGDGDLQVAIRAAVALHHLGDPEAVGKLEAFYEKGSMADKIAVADALGDVEAEDAYPLLNLMLANERDPRSGPLRATALRSLARSGHENAMGLLVFYLLNDLDPAVQLAAANALVDVQSEEARFALVRALTEGRPDEVRRARLLTVLGKFRGRVVREVLASYLEDEVPAVRQAAALGLAEQNDGTAVPYLIEMVRSGDPDQAAKAVRALENLSLERFEGAGYATVAEQYDRWYQAARITVAREPDRAWLREKLRSLGYDVGPLEPYVEGEADPVAVPLLIRALRDEDPLVRRGAAIALERITGLSMGEVGRSTSRRDAAQVAAEWSRWWERVSGPGGPANR